MSRWVTDRWVPMQVRRAIRQMEDRTTHGRCRCGQCEKCKRTIARAEEKRSRKNQGEQ